MEKTWKEIRPEDLSENVFTMIGTDWMLITAGTPDDFNTMTASWGAMGVLWGKNTAFCFVRPSRHTYSFMEKVDRYTLSFFPSDFHDALSYCGAHSGRDVNKPKEAGLTPCAMPGDTVSFEEARLVLVCRKLYFQDLNPAAFLDSSIDRNYPGGDFHRMYIGLIETCRSNP